MINLTTAAAKKLKEVIPSDEVIRLAIRGGGCSGFQYEFGLTPIEDVLEDDHIIERDGVELHVDVFSFSYLENVVIDYEVTALDSVFKIKNPGAKSTCGCGSSFN